jgi:hypothetical protein
LLAYVKNFLLEQRRRAMPRSAAAGASSSP